MSTYAKREREHNGFALICSNVGRLRPPFQDLAKCEFARDAKVRVDEEEEAAAAVAAAAVAREFHFTGASVTPSRAKQNHCAPFLSFLVLNELNPRKNRMEK